MSNEQEHRIAARVAATLSKLNPVKARPIKALALSNKALKQPRDPNYYLLDPNGRPVRSYCLRRIRYLADTYELRWIVTQTLIDYGYDSLRAAIDDEIYLIALDMELARRCQVEHDNLEDYGLVRRV